MNLFTTTPVFNPELKGKAVRIEGRDGQGYEWYDICLIKDVIGESILLIDCNGDCHELHINNFQDSWTITQMTLTILEGWN